MMTVLRKIKNPPRKVNWVINSTILIMDQSKLHNLLMALEVPHNFPCFFFGQCEGSKGAIEEIANQVELQQSCIGVGKGVIKKR